MMKKPFVKILSLLLALILLAGCGSETVYTFAPFSAARKEPLCFEDIEYVRPELDAMHTALAGLHDALEKPDGHEEIVSCIENFDVLSTNFYTMYTVAQIRSSLDMSDGYYDEEYGWCMEAEAEVQLLTDELWFACAESEHVDWLEDFYFYEGFAAELQNSETVGTYDEYYEVTARETELLTRYRDIMSDISIEAEGNRWSLEEYRKHVGADKAYAAYYEKYNPILAELYAELIETRRDYAAIMGSDDCAAMNYELGFGREYTPQQAEEYMEHIKEHMLPLFAELKDMEAMLSYDELDERDMELYLETAVEGFGGRIEEAYDFMKEYRMYDFSISPNKVKSSFKTYLLDYGAPYLFLYPTGYCEDISTICHEFGHYADGYIRDNADESIDLAEVFSQAMVLLSLSRLHCVMTDKEYENYRLMTLLSFLRCFQEQCAFAEFELRAHKMQEPTVDKLNGLYAEIAAEYGIECDEVGSKRWVDVTHFFEDPFYVISYPVSAAAALEIYERELENEGAGVELFVEMSAGCLPGIQENARQFGLNEPLSEESVLRCEEFLRNQLKK